MTDDRQLVTRFVRDRDDQTFRVLYRRHTPFLYGMACRLSAGADDVAADLVQDTWVRAVPRFADFQWKSQLRTWLAGVLINCHRESLRSARRTNEPAPDADQLAAPVDAVDARLDLDAALTRLSDGYREVFVLYHVYGYTHAQIASQLDIDEGTSKSQLARGRRRLAQLLADSAEPSRKPKEMES